MGIEFKEVGEKKVVVARRAIFMQGQEVGEIHDRGETGPGSRYHAVFNIKNKYCLLNAGLAQGHGETEIEAVEDAFCRSKQDAGDYLAGVESLEQMYLEAKS